MDHFESDSGESFVKTFRGSCYRFCFLALFFASSASAEIHSNMDDSKPIRLESESPEAPPISSTASADLPKPPPKYRFAFTTAVEFPQPLVIGVQINRTDSPDLAVFYEGGFFKYPVTYATRSFTDYSFAAGVRYHPFHNWFYTSAELGFRQIGLSVDISNLKQDGLALANTATLSMGTFFLGLLVGGEWKLSENVGLAFDLGIQFALLHTGGISIQGDPTQDTDPNDLTVDDSKEMSRISGLPLPEIALFRFIWYI